MQQAYADLSRALDFDQEGAMVEIVQDYAARSPVPDWVAVGAPQHHETSVEKSGTELVFSTRFLPVHGEREEDCADAINAAYRSGLLGPRANGIYRVAWLRRDGAWVPEVQAMLDEARH